MIPPEGHQAAPTPAHHPRPRHHRVAVGLPPDPATPRRHDWCHPHPRGVPVLPSRRRHPLPQTRLANRPLRPPGPSPRHPHHPPQTPPPNCSLPGSTCAPWPAGLATPRAVPPWRSTPPWSMKPTTAPAASLLPASHDPAPHSRPHPTVGRSARTRPSPPNCAPPSTPAPSRPALRCPPSSNWPPPTRRAQHRPPRPHPARPRTPHHRHPRPPSNYELQPVRRLSGPISPARIAAWVDAINRYSRGWSATLGMLF